MTDEVFHKEDFSRILKYAEEKELPITEKAISEIASATGDTYTCTDMDSFTGAVTANGFGAIAGSTAQSDANKIYINGLTDPYYVVKVYTGNGSDI